MPPAPRTAVLALLLGGCVVVEERPESVPVVAVPIAIPLATPTAADDTPQELYYRSVLEQVRIAWADHDAFRIRALVDQHDRADAPTWARQQFDSFRRSAGVLEFEGRILGRGEVGLEPAAPALGEPIAGRLLLGPFASAPVALGGADSPAPARFLVRLEILDRDPFGDRSMRQTTAVVDLPERVDFGAGGRVELPFSLAAPAAGSVLRTLLVSVELMPGHVEYDGVRVANGRVRLAASEHTLYPRGVEVVRAQPLLTLRNALRAGESRYFANAYLAAHFLARDGTSADREAALGLLVDRVRLGRPDQTRPAMAAAALLVPDPPQVGDRAAWLQWWNARPTRAPR